MLNKKFLVAVPAYNCSKQISKVIKQYIDSDCEFFTELLIIDNRSQDETLKNAVQYAEYFPDKKISIIQNEENYNLGGTHKVAFNYCIQGDFDGIVILHGDDQGCLKDIEGALMYDLNHDYDCILGARFMSESRITGYPALRIFGNLTFNFIYSVTTGFKIYDMGSGLNFFSRKLISETLHHKMPDDLTFNSAFLLAMICSNKKIKFTPISWREEDQISNAKLWAQSFKLIGYLLKFKLDGNKFCTLEFRLIPRQNYNFSFVKKSA